MLSMPLKKIADNLRQIIVYSFLFTVETSLSDNYNNNQRVSNNLRRLNDGIFPMNGFEQRNR